jgi:hypothetical protein
VIAAAPDAAAPQPVPPVGSPEEDLLLQFVELPHKRNFWP